MSVHKIFGDWEQLPIQGKQDDLARLWHKIAAQGSTANFGTSQRRHELIPLLELYQRAQPKIVIEVGVAQSGTMCCWTTLGTKTCTIIGVDQSLNDSRPRPGEPVDSMFYSGTLKMYDQGGGFLHLRKHQQQLYGVNGWTTEQSTKDQLARILNHRKADWIWNDASHSKELFAHDFQWLWPLLDEGGVFCAHDIMPSKADGCDKSVEWERIKREEEYSACYEFKGSRHDDSMGIGVLIK